jgi:hypothetical protein
LGHDPRQKAVWELLAPMRASNYQFPLYRHPDLFVDHRRVRSAAVAEPRGANADSRDRLRWPESNRNGGRHQIEIAGRIASEFAERYEFKTKSGDIGSSCGAEKPSVFGQEAMLFELTRRPENDFEGQFGAFRYVE